MTDHVNDTTAMAICKIAKELRAEADNLSPTLRTHPAGQMIKWAERLERIVGATR